MVTIKELREFIKNLPDEMEVFTMSYSTSENGTTFSNEVAAVDVSVRTVDTTDINHPCVKKSPIGRPVRSGWKRRKYAMDGLVIT